MASEAGFAVVLDGFLEPKPVGVSAAVSYLQPGSCNLTYLVRLSSLSLCLFSFC